MADEEEAIRYYHWALQYLEKARAAIFEAKNMARIGPDHRYKYN